MTATEDLQHLSIELEGEIEHFRELQQQVDEATLRFPTEVPDIYDLRSVAMLLTEIYLGAENLMRQIAKRLGETIPTGGAWHQQLLAQFSTEVPELRPALFSPQTTLALDEFRRFRHVTHHAYSIQFDWTQIAKLLAKATPTLEMLIDDAEAFKVFLAQASDKEG
jgi:hypothetical protein